MPLSANNFAKQEKLKAALQGETSAHKLEKLAANLLGRLLGIPVAVAKSGFQHGGDAGTPGQLGRRLRLECKKYGDETRLSDRELLGEIDQALARDEALEGWILVATRAVPEQLAQDLVQKGERLGVPIIIIDWRDHELAPLAALCSFEPGLVEMEISKEAGASARALRPAAGDAIALLQRNLKSWCLGFEALRSRSHNKLEGIWNLPRISNAELGQDAAGGAQPKKIRRRTSHDALTAWWSGPARDDAPAAIIGWDGVGKTWAALDWLVDQHASQPIVLVIPSSALGRVSGVSEATLKGILADRLLAITGIRDREHWLRRLDYLLKRPPEEGPVLTVLFDGLNQEPSVSWLLFFKVLQAPAFEGRVRVMMTTRKHHFEDKLACLRGLAVSAVSVSVDVYDVVAGGELDQMLAFEQLSRVDLHPDLVELARTPRLFRLVVRFRERLVEAKAVTLHRLLWEYGRDTFGERAGKSFSEHEWRAWLGEIARRYRSGVREFTLKALGETAGRPDLSDREVYARLSDIIDGRFAKPGLSGDMQLDPTVVAHSLGAALLSHLDAMDGTAFAAIEAEVAQWLDPIAGLDQRAEILRAAVSILVERGGTANTPAAGVLVTAWLQTQNVTDGHRRELATLAPYIPQPLLDAVEQSDARAQASARLWAVNALRAIPREEGPTFDVIIARARSWLSVVSREVNIGPDADTDFERRRADRYRARVGADESGSRTVLSVELRLVDHDDGRLQALVPSILEGFPVSHLTPCFEAAAIAFAVRGRAEWGGLQWLCYLNEIDPAPMAEALREIAADIRMRVPEPGIHPGLPARAAALLLWLSGQLADEETAASTDSGIDRHFTYEKDYLANPGRSWFALERRHAHIALCDKDVNLRVRLDRTKELWLDPTFQPERSFVEELCVAAAGFDVEKLDRQMGHTYDDLLFEVLAPALARCAPDLLAELAQRKLQSLGICPPQSRYWAAIQATTQFILAGSAEADAAQALRLSACETEANHEGVAAATLLEIELQAVACAQAQFDRLIAADLKFIPADFGEVVCVPTTDDADILIERYGSGSPKQQYDLIVLMSIHPVPFSDLAWSWLINFARQTQHELQHVLFRMLARSDESRFGRILATEGWSWDTTAHFWVNHYGTGALIRAELGLPFDQLAPRLAPWRLLEAAHVRGADPAEVRMAAEIFSHALAADKIEEPDPGSTLTVDRTERAFPPSFISATPRPDPEEQRNPLAAALDTEARSKAHARAFEMAIARIEEARKSGASLYLTEVQAVDFEPVLQHAPDMLDRWLEGHRERTTDFRRRVRLAETSFLALCEALLGWKPELGAGLWHALRATMTIRYIGAGGIEELLNIVFRVPDSVPVIELREELISLPHCHTDQRLFDIAVAAAHNKKTKWLASVIAADQKSSLVWRQRRGVLLAGFTVENTLPVPEAWPEAEIRTSHADLQRKAASYRWSEACARHWWRSYLAAPDAIAAYAAWVLFLRSADRRAWIWMGADIKEHETDDSFFDRKLSHAQLNRSELKREMGRRIEKAEKKFLDQEITEGVGPWGKITDGA